MTMSTAASTMEVELDLPGFRFHPTEEELLGFYLSRVALGKKLHFDIIGTLNIYRHDPWDLPAMSKIGGEREWYFFVPRGRKAGNGGRPNRTTERGFWKATGSDRAIRSTTGDPKRVIGLKKTLVFYQGRAPRGTRTDWVMNEYRLPDAGAVAGPPKEDIVLCKIYRKATPLKELEQRASAMEERMMQSFDYNGVYGGAARACPVAVSGSVWYSDDVQDNFLFHSYSSSSATPSGNSMNDDAPREAKKEADVATVTVASVSSLPRAANPPSNFQLPAANPPCSFQLPAANQPCSLQIPAASNGVFDMPSLQLPAASPGVFDWLQDPFLTQLRSPWQDQHCMSPYAHLIYY